MNAKNALRHWFALCFCLMNITAFPQSISRSASPQSITVAPASPDLVTAPVDPDVTVLVTGHVPAWVETGVDRGPVAGNVWLQNLSILLTQTPQQKAALDQLMRDQQDPKSPEYHHWIQPEEYGARFGASQHDITAVINWLASQGLTVDRVSHSRRFIYFSGSAETVGSALGVEFHTYRVPATSMLPGNPATEDLISITNEPQVPSALAPVISSIIGLSALPTRPMYAINKQAHPRIGGRPQPGVTVQANSFYAVGPADFATIYDINPLYQANVTGSGQTIAIIGASRVCMQDITDYQTLFGITFSMPTEIIPTGGIDPGAADCSANPQGSGDQGEQTLDVTRSGSVATGAKLDLIVSGSSQTVSGLSTALSYAIDSHSTLNDNIITMSYGGCETSDPASVVQAHDQLFQTAAAAGISVFVSSGDSGVGLCANHGQPPVQSNLTAPTVNGLASSGYVTSVGGTEFNDANNYSQYWSPNNGPGAESALGYIPEGAWNEPTSVNAQGQTVLNIAGSTGGVSQYIATPSWQTGNGVPGTQGRYQPDISFTASGHDGYIVCLTQTGNSCSQQNFNPATVYGTSATAPDMAGITALADQKLNAAQGNLNPNLYKLAASATNVFHDVTVQSSGVTNCDVNTPSMCNNSDPGPNSLTVSSGNGLAGYLVGPGYDEVTGLGSLDVSNYIAALVALGSGGGGGSGLTPTVALASSAASITTAQTVTFTATVSGTGATPTGTVQFMVNGKAAGTPLTLSNGVATTPTVSFSAAGSYSISAQYSGDTNYTAATSTATIVTVTATTVPLTPTVALASSAASITTAQTVIFTATVSGKGATPTGTVQLMVNGKAAGTPLTLSNGVATTPTVSFSAAGSYSISAQYSGDTNYTAATSTATTVTVTATTVPLTPTVALASSAASITTAQTVIFTATVSGKGATPTGTVQLMVNGKAAGTPLTLSNGVATTPTVSFSAAGSYSISAQYSGDTNYTAATSTATTVTVTATGPPPAPTFTLTATPLTISTVGATTGNASTITATGQNGFAGTVTMTCSVAYTGTGTANDAPTCALSNNGSVTLSAGTTTGTVTATFTTTAASMLSHKLTARASTLQRSHGQNGNMSRPAGLLLACLLLLPVGYWRRSSMLRGTMAASMFMGLALLALLTTLTACGGSSSGGGGGTTPTNPGTSTGAYTVTVSGTGAGVTQTTTFTITVQ